MSKVFFGSVVVTVLLLFIVIAGGVKVVLPAAKVLPGDPVPTITAKKLARGEKHGEYTSTPPTSGWFIESKLRDGFHTASITDEEIVGALHQGKVAIAYNCQYGLQAYYPSKAPSPSPEPIEKPVNQSQIESQETFRMIQAQNKACAEVIEGLRSLVRKTGQNNVILFPYTKMDTRITLLTWGRMDRLMWMDEGRISEFIKAYRGKKIISK